MANQKKSAPTQVVDHGLFRVIERVHEEQNDQQRFMDALVHVLRKTIQ
jgi:hypothetical protein